MYGYAKFFSCMSSISFFVSYFYSACVHMIDIRRDMVAFVPYTQHNTTHSLPISHGIVWNFKFDSCLICVCVCFFLHSPSLSPFFKFDDDNLQ